MRGGELSLYLLLPTLLGVALLGWIAGMWTHKRAEHWCPVDGSQLGCLQCKRAAVEQPEAQRLRPMTDATSTPRWRVNRHGTA
jgi:hypothetical protein